jgi:hypothetical protein
MFLRHIQPVCQTQEHARHGTPLSTCRWLKGVDVVFEGVSELGRVPLNSADISDHSKPVKWSLFISMSGGHAMVPFLFYYQLAILVLLWVCVMLSSLWPGHPVQRPGHPPGPSKPSAGTPASPHRLRASRTSHPFPCVNKSLARVLTQRPRNGPLPCRQRTAAPGWWTPPCTSVPTPNVTIAAGWYGSRGVHHNCPQPAGTRPKGFGLAGASAFGLDGRGWCPGSATGWTRPEVGEHDKQPEQDQDHQLIVDEVWYHGMPP